MLSEMTLNNVDTQYRERSRSYRANSIVNTTTNFDFDQRRNSTVSVTNFQSNVPFIDDGLDINGWFSQEIHLPTESQEERHQKKNYVWILMKSILFKWNWLYNNYTIFMKLIFFLVYFIIGVAFYNSTEGWNVLDCVYFISISVTTIGLGDFHPTNDMTRLFSIPYFLIGCTIVINIFITLSRTYIRDCQDEIIYQIQRFRGLEHKTLRPLEISFYRLMMSLFFVCITIFVGTLFFSSSEGWTVIYSMYFSTVSMMFAIGYGDRVPGNENVRLFCIFYEFMSSVVFYVSVSLAIDDWSAAAFRRKFRESLEILPDTKFNEKWFKRVLKPPKNSPIKSHDIVDVHVNDILSRKVLNELEDNEESIANPLLYPPQSELQKSEHSHTNIPAVHDIETGEILMPGQTSKERFILFVLSELGILSHYDEIVPLAKKFDELDHKKVGYLTHKELLEFRKTIEVISRTAKGYREVVSYSDLNQTNSLAQNATVPNNTPMNIRPSYSQYNPMLMAYNPVTSIVDYTNSFFEKKSTDSNRQVTNNYHDEIDASQLIVNTVDYDKNSGFVDYSKRYPHRVSTVPNIP